MVLLFRTDRRKQTPEKDSKTSASQRKSCLTLALMKMAAIGRFYDNEVTVRAQLIEPFIPSDASR